MKSGDTRREPVAIPLGSAEHCAVNAAPTLATIVREETDFTTEATLAAEEANVEKPARSWLSTLLWGALSLLVSLYLVDAAWDLVARMQAKSPLFGQVALALVALVGVLLVLFLLRESFALLRMRKVDRLRDAVKAARETLDSASARAAVSALSDFYARDAHCAQARAEISRALGEIHDPATLLDIAERALMSAKDKAAREAIASAVQRVSVFTAVSPRAIVDIAFVLAQMVALIRKLSEIYGGRASGYALWRLLRRIASSLAITGGVAVADTLMGQILGAGLAARLSAKLGEGVLNGVLLARVGIAALHACRPMDFVANPPVILSEVVKITVFQDRVAENPAS